MALEIATYINDLNIANPTETDDVSQGNDHIQLLKSVLKNSLPMTSAATASGLSVLQGTANVGADALGAYRKGTILGTVSQTAGVPTGAIIEVTTSGLNKAIKFADGTLICTNIVLANATLTPGQFVGSVAPIVTPVGDYVITGTCYLYAAAAQGGNNLYSVPMSYTPNSVIWMNTGISPQVSAPSFTLGSTSALSYRLTQQIVGRWF